MVNSLIDDLGYWENRAGQIRWRLDAMLGTTGQMEKDIAECNRNIKRINGTAQCATCGDYHGEGEHVPYSCQTGDGV